MPINAATAASAAYGDTASAVHTPFCPNATPSNGNIATGIRNIARSVSVKARFSFEMKVKYELKNETIAMPISPSDTSLTATLAESTSAGSEIPTIMSMRDGNAQRTIVKSAPDAPAATSP